MTRRAAALRTLVLTAVGLAGLVGFVGTVSSADAHGLSPARGGVSAPTPSSSPTIIVDPPPLPPGTDAMIRKASSSTYTGNFSYGPGQRIHQQVAEAGGRVVAYVRVINRANSQRVHFRGTPSTRYFAVRYFVGTTEVTRQVVAGTYRTPVLAYGQASARIRVVVYRAYYTPGGKSQIFRITASGPIGLDDVVSTEVTAKPGSPIVVP